MLGISELSKKMPASPIRKLVPFADAAKKRGTKVYHLNIGQPDIDSPKEAIDAVKNTKLTLVSYPHSAGIESYRKGLAGYYQQVGIDLSYDEIIVTEGGSEALQIILNICCNPGDEVIVFEPFYTNYNTFALISGVKFVPIPTSIESGFALPPMSEIEKYITPRTKAILLNNPGNPTGTLYSREAILEIGEIVKKHSIYLLSDEVYREFCYTDTPHFSCMNIPGADQNVVLIDSVSKRYSLCGVRIGCIASHNKEVMSAVLRFAQARLCAPALGQIAGEGALATPKNTSMPLRLST
jgi:aspartate aminotransferase